MKPLRSGAAGTFYPADRMELERAVDGFLAEAEIPALPGPVLAVMSPHAGYRYSGKIAGLTWRALAEQGGEPEAVFILCNSHSLALPSASVYAPASFETPLGSVKNHGELSERFRSRANFDYVEAAHLREHPLECHLPFMQRVFPGCPVVLVSLGPRAGVEDRAAESLAALWPGRDIRVVVSSDMSHYPPPDLARRSDQRTLEAIQSLDPTVLDRALEENFEESGKGLETCLCGEGALRALLQAGKGAGLAGVSCLGYADSGEITGDSDRAVGYGALAFYGSPDSSSGALSENEGKEMLRLARESLATLAGAPPPAPVKRGRLAGLKRAAFVTLMKGGRLRGCLGRLQPDRDLASLIPELALDSATEDPRFEPVRGPEIGELDVQVSVLSPFRPCVPAEIVPGLHGVLARAGGRQGLFLPEVATEQGWDRATLIRKVIQEKAGLPSDILEQGAELFRFTTQKFK